MIKAMGQARYGRDYIEDIRAGLVPGKSMAFINGINFALTGTSQVDVSDQNTIVEPLGAAGGEFEIISSSTQDASGGTGTTLVLITMMNLDWEYVQVVMAPTGTGATQIAGGPYLRAISIIGIVTGSTHLNVGNVDIRTVSGSLVHLRMGIYPSPNNSSFSGFYPIPAGTQVEVYNVAPFTGKADEVVFQPYLRQQNGNLVSGQPIVLDSGNANKRLFDPALLTQKQDLIFRCQRISGGGNLLFSLIIELIVTVVPVTANPT